MKVGLLARAEDRGLGILTWEWFRHMQPYRTLLIDLGDLARGFAQFPDRFPGATVARWTGGELDEDDVRAWLDGLDVVYSAETFYDWRICEWARDAGVRTVCHLMPEFYRHGHDVSLPEPDVWWLPTTWRLTEVDQFIPPDVRVVPVPVPTDRWPEGGIDEDGPLRVLHSIGHRATADRNGTTALLRALRFVREPMQVTLHTQDFRSPSTKVPAHVQVDTIHGGCVNYWDAYAWQDVLVLPRRYGGLSMPVLEAAGAGLAVVMSDAEPQRTDWPFVRRAPARKGPRVETPAGAIDTADTDPRALAVLLDALASDRAALADAACAARRWAEDHSWEALWPTVTAELERACG